ncbi:MAG TPA: cellulase family glycosylhydrolase [Actinomycetota bacterium]
MSESSAPAMVRFAIRACALATVLVVIQASAAVADNNPQAWTETTSLPPSFTPRWDSASSAFPTLGEVILFGGGPISLGQSWWNDTWVYSDATQQWTKGPAAPAGLTPRSGAAMAYDPDIDKIVLFGGAGPSWPPYDDTWLFDGTSWTPGPAAPAALEGRTGAEMAFDPDIGKIVMFGGSGLDGYDDTWLFDGSSWTQGPAAPNGMGARVNFGMTYDPTLAAVVVAGGDGGADVWLFDGTSWSPGPTMPDGVADRERVKLVYDPQLEGDVMFGGLGPGSATTTTNILADSQWSTVTVNPRPRPQARLDAQIVWDTGADAFMVFGGETKNGAEGLSDSWILVAPPLKLSPRSGPVGTVVSVTSGPGWPEGGSVHVVFMKRLLETVTADADGNISTSVTVPGSAPGPKTFVVSNTDIRVSVSTTFTVTGSQDGPRSQPNVPGGHDGAGAGAPAVASAPAPPAHSPLRQGQTPIPATGQITVADGQFELNSQPVALRGLDVSPLGKTDIPDADYADMESWNMNVVRFFVHWSDMEPNPPVLQGTTWKHTWNMGKLNRLKNEIALAYNHGEYVLIEDYCGPPCMGNGWPDWTYDAPYNSHQITYTDPVQAATDYWTDPLRQQFTMDFLSWLAKHLADTPGILGYEALNEPAQGTYPSDSETTAMIMKVELALCQAIRESDPPRVIFFTTRGGAGAGAPNANFNGYKTLGNVAFDLHDYFGGRWGDGLNMNPASPTYGEQMSEVNDFTIDVDTPPYMGTTYGQERYMLTIINSLKNTGIPVFIGELGGRGEDEPNIITLFATMTGAANSLDISWTAMALTGRYGVLKQDGTTEPWLQTLIDAAGA